MSLYQKRGVSAQKEDVHKAVERLSKGLFPHAFCKLYEDHLAGDKDWVNVMHADGAGTKSILAYLYWKETDDISVWKGIAKDAIIMNLDDLICTGITDNISFSSTIDRNKFLIPGDILETIISGSIECFEELSDFGIRISYLGGETADVGDVVRTIAVNGTMAARWPVSKIISNEKIRPGDVIVGLESSGKAIYEKEYNSGIGSNGLTSARHDLLHKYYSRFPETFDPGLDASVVYTGPYRLTDKIDAGGAQTDIGKLLLSPTRTFAPVIKKMIDECFAGIHGMIHCSGGGQTKCLKYLPHPMRIIKDALPEVPPVFRLIGEAGKVDEREMYQVFNMGCRLEIFCPEEWAEKLVAIAAHFGIAGNITGRVEAAEKSELVIRTGNSEIIYSN